MEKSKKNKIMAILFLVSLLSVPAVFGYDWFFTDEEFNAGTFLCMQASGNSLELTSHLETLNYLWAANSGESSVSKVDTTNNKELARYWTCPNMNTGVCSPSRTSVDPEGNVWVGNRMGSFEVVKVAGNQDYCVDRNGNGKIDTSYDANDNGIISTDEMLPWGQDECVLVHVNYWPDIVTGVGPRALAIDLNGYVWVGLWEGRRFVKLRPNDGGKVTEVSLASTGVADHPYGAAVDENGYLWSLNKDSTSSLTKINTVTNTVVGSYSFGWLDIYSIAVDKHNRIWAIIYWAGGLLQINALNPLQYQTHPAPDGGRGVTFGNDGNVWVSNSQTGTVTKYLVSGTTYPTAVSVGCSVSVGGWPIGMVMDSNNYIWAVSYYTGNASKINPSDCSIVAQVPVGLFPYSYSDLTGSLLYQFIKSGSWVITLQNPNDFNNFWKNVSWTESNNNGNNVIVKRKVLSDHDFVQIVNGERFDIASPNLILQVTLKRNDDGTSPILGNLHVEASCISTENLEVSCSDGSDNDCDSLVDCDDPGCVSEDVCKSCDPNCVLPVCHPHSEVCTNGFDDNCNGLVDCRDLGCSDNPICKDCKLMCPLEMCNPRYEVCDNSFDDDCDGLIDCDDIIDCTYHDACKNCDPIKCSAAVCKPSPEMCNDKLDNDCDGLVDCFDSDDCCAHPFCEGASSCCTLNNATWEVDTCPGSVEVVGNGTLVNLVAFGNPVSVCQGKELSFRIFSKTNSDIPPFPPKGKFTGGKVVSNWTVVWEYANGDDPEFGFSVDGVGVPPVNSTNKVKVCEVGGKPDDDCDKIPNDEDTVCPNTPCNATYVETSGVCKGCSEEQCKCVSAVDCTGVDWSECNDDNQMTRNICKDQSNTDPVYLANCCNNQEDCKCDLKTCLGHSNWIPTVRDCLNEEEFGFFSPYSILMVLSLLVCYYFFVRVKKGRVI